MSERLVTKEDLQKYPLLNSQGVSANQHYDFSHVEKLQIGQSTSIVGKHYDIIETPSFVPYEVVKPVTVQTATTVKSETIKAPTPIPTKTDKEPKKTSPKKSVKKAATPNKKK